MNQIFQGHLSTLAMSETSVLLIGVIPDLAFSGNMRMKGPWHLGMNASSYIKQVLLSSCHQSRQDRRPIKSEVVEILLSLQRYFAFLKVTLQ